MMRGQMRAMATVFQSMFLKNLEIEKLFEDRSLFWDPLADCDGLTKVNAEPDRIFV